MADHGDKNGARQEDGLPLSPFCPASSSHHPASFANGLDQRDPVDAGRPRPGNCCQRAMASGVAAVQEAIGGEQHQGAHLTLVLLERADQQAQSPRVSRWPAW